MPLDAGVEHLVRAALHQLSPRRSRPRVAREAGASIQRADARQVDHAVAHHAAVVEQVGGRHQPVADVVGEQALAAARARSAPRASGPTTRGRRRRATPSAAACAAGRAGRSRSSACSSVLTQARSAAYIGCSGSIASGMPAARAYSSSLGDAVVAPSACARPSRSFDGAEPGQRAAAGRRRPAPGRRCPAPPPRRPRAGCRRAPPRGLRAVGREHAAAAVAGELEPGVLARLARRGRARPPRPGRATARSRACRAGRRLRRCARRSPCFRTVAVLMESRAWSARSRAFRLHCHSGERSRARNP